MKGNDDSSGPGRNGVPAQRESIFARRDDESQKAQNKSAEEHLPTHHSRSSSSSSDSSSTRAGSTVHQGPNHPHHETRQGYMRRYTESELEQQSQSPPNEPRRRHDESTESERKPPRSRDPFDRTISLPYMISEVKTSRKIKIRTAGRAVPLGSLSLKFLHGRALNRRGNLIIWMWKTRGDLESPMFVVAQETTPVVLPSKIASQKVPVGATYAKAIIHGPEVIQRIHGFAHLECHMVTEILLPQESQSRSGIMTTPTPKHMNRVRRENTQNISVMDWGDSKFLWNNGGSFRNRE